MSHFAAVLTSGDVHQCMRSVQLQQLGVKTERSVENDACHQVPRMTVALQAASKFARAALACWSQYITSNVLSDLQRRTRHVDVLPVRHKSSDINFIPAITRHIWRAIGLQGRPVCTWPRCEAELLFKS